MLVLLRYTLISVQHTQRRYQVTVWFICSKSSGIQRVCMHLFREVKAGRWRKKANKTEKRKVTHTLMNKIALLSTCAFWYL